MRKFQAMRVASLREQLLSEQCRSEAAEQDARDQRELVVELRTTLALLRDQVINLTAGQASHSSLVLSVFPWPDPQLMQRVEVALAAAGDQ